MEDRLRKVKEIEGLKIKTTMAGARVNDWSKRVAQEHQTEGWEGQANAGRVQLEPQVHQGCTKLRKSQGPNGRLFKRYLCHIYEDKSQHAV